MKGINLKPIGIVKNNVKEPRFGNFADEVSEIIIDKKFTGALKGTEDYSHVIIVYWMDKEKECHLKHHPQGREDIQYIGIFACRCPQRPNRIAFSTVKLLSRKANILKVTGLDIVDGTPILDIKPYTHQYDKVANPKVPAWVNRLVF